MLFSAYHFKKVCRQTLNSNDQFKNLLSAIRENEDTYDGKIYTLPENDYWSLKPSKDINLYKKPSKKTIFLGKEPQKSFDLFDKFIKKRKIENYYPFPIRLREKELLKYLKYVTKIKK